MSENDDPESTIPWPGFVDILSTVIIVFVFFMMMTSVIIFVLSEQAKKDAVANAKEQTKEQSEQKETKKEKSEAQSEQKENSTLEKLQPDVNNLLMEKDELKKEIAKLTQLKNVLSESQQQTVGKNEGTMIIHYGDMGATLTKETDDFIRNNLVTNKRIVIQSSVPPNSNFASIREIALNRALNIRNILLQAGVPNDQIALRIVTQEETGAEPSDLEYGSVKIDTAQ